jgi:hypothetical protein
MRQVEAFVAKAQAAAQAHAARANLAPVHDAARKRNPGQPQSGFPRGLQH